VPLPEPFRRNYEQVQRRSLLVLSLSSPKEGSNWQPVRNNLEGNLPAHKAHPWRIPTFQVKTAE
jgi:hypothetical protein